MKSPIPPQFALSVLFALLAVALFSACGPDRDTAEIDGQPLAGSNWRLVEAPGLDVPESAISPELRFGDEPGHLSGSSGVNRVTGPYTMEGSQLTFGELATTRMGGPPEAMEFESRYLESLRSVDTWRMRGGYLELVRGGTVVAVFRRVSENEADES
ncbi:MAG: META domain-containing protein [Opitutales bacterium]|nr:META domain-containing protein [Opitutales bacterium]